MSLNKHFQHHYSDRKNKRSTYWRITNLINVLVQKSLITIKTCFPSDNFLHNLGSGCGATPILWLWRWLRWLHVVRLSWLLRGLLWLQSCQLWLRDLRRIPLLWIWILLNPNDLSTQNYCTISYVLHTF